MSVDVPPSPLCVYGSGVPPGVLIEHDEPEIVSSTLAPFSSAVASTNIFIDDPGWRTPCVARFTFDFSKPGPPTNARTAPLDGSTVTIATVPRQWVPSFSEGHVLGMS